MAICLLCFWNADSIAGDFDLALVSINPQNFPYLYVDIAANDDSLPASAFEVYEDGTRQTDQLHVVPPAQGGGVKVVDVAFMMDNSGSMGDDQAAVAANVDAFVIELGNRGFDYTLGLCRFGSSDNSGYPILEDVGTLTDDSAYFLNDLWTRNDTSGGFEPGWDAICDSSAGLTFRPGALKVLILITDESTTGHGNVGDKSKQEAIDALAANDILLFALISQDAASIDDYGTIALETGGAYYDVQAQMDTILQQISDAVTNTYRISYKSSDPTLDGLERTVVIDVASGGKMDSCAGTYVPGAAPTIVRTQTTVNLGTQPWAAGTEFAIQADVEDTVPPGVQGVTLHYRTTGTVAYTAVAMIPGSTRYTGIISGADVVQPAVEYYISATDGQSTVTSPSVSAAASPYQIAIFPNVRPLITHTSVATYTQGTAIDIAADVVDQTTAVDSVSVFYRTVGQLVYQEIALQPVVGNSYSGQIPQAATSGQDIEYYVKATDDYGVSSYSCDDPGTPHIISQAGGGVGGPVTEVIIGMVRFKCPSGFSVNGSVYSAQGEVNVSDLLYFVGSIELNKTTAVVRATGRVELRTNVSLVGTVVIFHETTYDFNASDFEFLWTGDLDCGFVLDDILPGIASIDATFRNYEFISLTIAASLDIPPIGALDIDRIVITKDGITEIVAAAKVYDICGFSIDDLSVDYRATSSGYKLDIFAQFQFPKPSNVDVEVRFGLVNGNLNTLILVASNLNFLVYPGNPSMWIEKLGGGVEDLQFPEKTVWRGMFGMSFAPAQIGPKIAFVEGEISLNAAGTFLATVGIRLFDPDGTPFANGELKIGSEGGYLKGEMIIGPLDIDGKVAVGSNGNFGGYLAGAITIQSDWPVIGPLACCYVVWCDGLLGIPYPCAWPCDPEMSIDVASVVFLNDKIGLEVLGIGLTYTTDPNYSEGIAVGDLHIGTNLSKLKEEVDKVVSSADRQSTKALASEFSVAEGTTILVVTASWNYGDMDLTLERPNGETISVADMVADPNTYQYRKVFISGQWQALVLVHDPPSGEWSAGPVNVSGVESYNLVVYGGTPLPSVAISAVKQTATNIVEIDWETDNADGADLWLFRTLSYGTLDGASAIVNSAITVSVSSGTYAWDTTGTPTGDYHIVAIVDDGRNAPRSAWSTDYVSIVNSDQLPAPTNLQATRIDNNSVGLQWDYAGPAGSTRGFIVYYTNEPHSVIFSGERVIPDGQACILDELSSDERYCIAVAAFDNDNSVGVLSEPVYVGGGDEWSNRPPIFETTPPDACQAGVPLLYLVRANDPDGDLLTYSLSEGPAAATLDPTSGLLLWTPSQEDVGSRSFQVDAQDAFGGSATQTFALDISVEAVVDGAAPLPVPELEDTVVICVGEDLFLDGCDDAAASQTLTYQWEVAVSPASRGSYELLSPSSCNAVFRALVPGDFRLRLTITTGGGGSTVVEIFVVAEVVDYPGQIICAPNPIGSDGAAFYYEIPGEADVARVHIYNILGRLVVELPLEADEVRFPAVGTWTPQTSDGDNLPNGAYVYVLVVDSRVVDWKKLVIYK